MNQTAINAAPIARAINNPMPEPIKIYKTKNEVSVVDGGGGGGVVGVVELGRGNCGIPGFVIFSTVFSVRYRRSTYRRNY